MPLIAAVGERETDEFRRQTAIYADVWRSQGYPVEHLVREDQNHYTIVRELSDPESPLTQAVIAQIRAHS